MKVLIAGGAGFIGSTIASACIDHDIEPIILDNLSTGRREFVVGRAFYEGDISDGELIDRIFRENPEISAIIHCAALIVVPESVADPLRYYTENLAKSIAFIGHLVRNECHRLIFSSSASIYAVADNFAVTEDSEIKPINPYARTKAMFETVLADIARAGGMHVVSLRYFNPIGADPKLRSGLQVRNPTHALGKMIQSQKDEVPFVITGIDWPTRDGSGIRDYVHVWDLAQAHIKALRCFEFLTSSGADEGYQVINLGTGTGTTVRELVRSFITVTGRELLVRESGPRPGDSAGAFCSGTRAENLLGWQPQIALEEGIRDTLAWFDIRESIIGA